jgi:hypothetical protein
LAGFAGQQCNAASIAFLHALLCQEEYRPERYPEWAMRSKFASASGSYLDFALKLNYSVRCHRQAELRLLRRQPAFGGVL